MNDGSPMKNLLYIVNFYGSPPLNYFEKYIKDNKLANLTIIKLPAVRYTRGRLKVDSLRIDYDNTKQDLVLDIPFIPISFLVFLVQYFVNLFVLLYLVAKSKTKNFDICIGETAFGSACAVLLKILGKTKFTVYMNGDVLPDTKLDKTYYLLSTPENYKLIKPFDTMLIKLQFVLRWMGLKADLIWYVTDIIKHWDEEHGLKTKNWFVSQVAAIDMSDFNTYSSVDKNNKYLAYIGRLDEFAGIDIAIQSLAIARRSIKDIRLKVVGGSSTSVDHYKEIAKKNDVLDNIDFYGYVPEMKDAFDILAACYIGLALYLPDKSNVSLFTDVSKVKEYIKLGLPVAMINEGPAIYKEINRYNAGIVAENNPNDIAKKIVRLMENDIEYKNLLPGLRKLAESLDYKSLFKNVWQKINHGYMEYNKKHGE